MDAKNFHILVKLRENFKKDLQNIEEIYEKYFEQSTYVKLYILWNTSGNLFKISMEKKVYDILCFSSCSVKCCECGVQCGRVRIVSRWSKM